MNTIQLSGSTVSQALWSEASVMSLNGAQLRSVERRKLIYGAGDTSRSVYFIRTGRVKVFHLTEEGKEVIISILTAGELFGESAISDHNAAREEYAEAMEDTQVWSAPVAAVLQLMKQDVEFNISFMQIIGNRLRKMQNRFVSQVFSSSHQRIQHFINDLARIEGVKTTDGKIEVQLDITHDEIGKILGTSRQTVTTVFSDLQRDGYISYTRNVLRLEKMQHVA
jgi:CRP/FNR family transcriptional regulator, cyclic AMP receptor protein